MEKKLPPQIRQRINKLAHALSVAAETSIHTHLTEQARDILFAASAITEADWADMAMTPADWQAMVMTPADWAAITLQAEWAITVIPPRLEAAPMLDVA